MAGGVPQELARRQTASQVAARGELELLGWAGFGWLTTVFTLVAAYYALRFALRRKLQSLLIASLAAGPIFFALDVMGLLPHTAGLVLMLCGGLYGTVFLLVLLDEVRRGAIQKGQGDDVDSGRIRKK